MSTIIVTGADLAQQALELLAQHDIVYAGKTPTEEDLVALCRAHDPVAIIVRYGFAQLGKTGRGSVMRPSALQGFHAGVDNIAWSVKIRLANLEVNNVASLDLQRARLH